MAAESRYKSLTVLLSVQNFIITIRVVGPSVTLFTPPLKIFFGFTPPPGRSKRGLAFGAENRKNRKKRAEIMKRGLKQLKFQKKRAGEGWSKI